MIEKEFIPYEEALALKELGFNRECFSWYREGILENEVNEIFYFTHSLRGDAFVSAPLYQQAFKWFRNHESIRDLNVFKSSYNYSYRIQTENPYTQTSEMGFNSYEEAELECLRKLIEIINQNKDD